jgi:hypothetical protein
MTVDSLRNYGDTGKTYRVEGENLKQSQTSLKGKIVAFFRSKNDIQARNQAVLNLIAKTVTGHSNWDDLHINASNVGESKEKYRADKPITGRQITALTLAAVNVRDERSVEAMKEAYPGKLKFYQDYIQLLKIPEAEKKDLVDKLVLALKSYKPDDERVIFNELKNIGRATGQETKYVQKPISSPKTPNAQLKTDNVAQKPTPTPPPKTKNVPGGSPPPAQTTAPVRPLKSAPNKQFPASNVQPQTDNVAQKAPSVPPKPTSKTQNVASNATGESQSLAQPSVSSKSVEQASAKKRPLPQTPPKTPTDNVAQGAPKTGNVANLRTMFEKKE